MPASTANLTQRGGGGGGYILPIIGVGVHELLQITKLYRTKYFEKQKKKKKTNEKKSLARIFAQILTDFFFFRICPNFARISPEFATLAIIFFFLWGGGGGGGGEQCPSPVQYAYVSKQHNAKLSSWNWTFQM